MRISLFGSVAAELRCVGQLTGYAATAVNRSDFLAGGMDMITKLFDLEKLGRKITSMLEGA
ncbi:hypothetical protein AB4Z40_30045 [Bosea sp. 2YAB26]|uniref:hypothetical protein n=1 Tax=Bosea sp. 2YAB26 TaxID=3237478 RepID=UPI003F8E0F63